MWGVPPDDGHRRTAKTVSRKLGMAIRVIGPEAGRRSRYPGRRWRRNADHADAEVIRAVCPPRYGTSCAERPPPPSVWREKTHRPRTTGVAAGALFRGGS